jgi:alkylhydroperoxidase/carboxymuconolactone decarboxylase family protein YurZ
MTTDDRSARLREEFIATHGWWTEAWENLLRFDPDFFEAYANFAAVPYRTGTLDPKVKAFLGIALNAAATHMNEQATRLHIERAFELGATRTEVLEVLELTATLGIHAANAGVPILLEVLEETGDAPDVFDLDDEQVRLKADFETNRGYWNPIWDGVLKLAPDFFETYLEFSSVPWSQGVLEPKVKELVYCAFDVASTHLWLSGLKLHIRNALGHGASAAEVLEVIEIASVLGMQAFEIGMPALVEAADRHGAAD